jgi:hypothetical protein
MAAAGFALHKTVLAATPTHDLKHAYDKHDLVSKSLAIGL